MFRTTKWLALLAGLAFATPASAAYQFEDITCQPTTTTGTGTVTLSGTTTNYLGFATTLTTGNTVPYSIVASNGKVETGDGVWTSAGATLTRVAAWSSDGVGAELTLPAGTHTVCVGWNTDTFTAGVANLDLLGLSLTNLTDLASIDATTETTLEAALDLADFADNYVASVADGTGVDGTATGVGSTYTPTLDFTEITPTVTWGAGSFTTMTFDVGATDIAFEFTSGVWTVDVGGTNELQLSATNFVPGAADGNALGSSSNGWADLWLATGGGVEFDGSTTNTMTCTGGTCTIEGDAIKQAGRQTLWIPAGAMTSRISSGAAPVIYDAGSSDNTIAVLDFDGATQEHAQFQVAMPKSWNESTVIYQALWTCTGCTAAETVAWELSCGAVSNDDSLNVTMGTIQNSDDAVLAAGDQHTSPESSAVTCGGTPAEGDYVIFNVRRNVATDNMNEDARLLGVKVYYTDNAANDD